MSTNNLPKNYYSATQTRLLFYTIVEFKYDANGNIINNGQFEFEYDYKNRLIRAVSVTVPFVKGDGEGWVRGMKYNNNFGNVLPDKI